MSHDGDRQHLPRLGIALVLIATLAACSDIYYDRRETVSFAAGDAVASAQAVQTVDPWPPASASRDISINGERISGAIARYRTGRVIAPVGLSTSASYSQQNANGPSTSSPTTGETAK